MVVRIVISGKGRGTTGEGEVESEVSDGKRTPTPSFCYRGVILKSAFIEEKFSQYLCFTVIIGSNNLISEQEYTEQQQQNYELIKSLHNGGIGYRKIAQYLNEQGIKTVRGNTWKNTQVFSVLKKYRARQERIQNVRLREHPIKISKFELLWY